MGRAWVGLRDFEQNISNITQVASKLAKKVVFIEIAKPRHFLAKNCGDFSNVVDQYNDVLKSNHGGFFLSIFDDVDLDNQLLQDGHHLTRSGHQNLADKIIKTIQER